MKKNAFKLFAQKVRIKTFVLLQAFAKKNKKLKCKSETIEKLKEIPTNEDIKYQELQTETEPTNNHTNKETI